MRGLTGTLAAGLLAWAAPAASATWIEQAQADLTCSGMARAAAQQALRKTRPLSDMPPVHL